MENSKTIACVTGASGMVGRKITQRLILNGYRVRVLSRKKHFNTSDVDLFNGGLDDEDTLRRFVIGAHMLFHCAAELNDESIMREVNVSGTERLLNIIRGTNIRYLCYLGSAGVVGRTNEKWVDENTICQPQSIYERTKWEAEQIVAEGIDNCNILILRPTNVIDNDRPGAINLARDGTLLSRLKVFLKGGECAHVVHVEDVAEAAMYFISKSFNSPQIYFVSCDHEVLNTYAGLWALYKAIEKNRPTEKIRPVLHLPLIVPHIMRRLWRGTGNRGDVRYSSQRLIRAGFTFRLGLEDAVRRVISMRSSN